MVFFDACSGNCVTAYGGPPPVARCTGTVTLTVPPGLCTTSIDQNTLLGLINAGSSSPLSPLTLKLQPAPATGTTYVLNQGQTYGFTLVASNSGGKDTCQSFVTVLPVPLPVARCAATLTLPATSACAAHPDAATLLKAVDAGSTGGRPLAF